MSATITIVHDDDGEVFIDVSCPAGENVSVVEALGILEVGRALLVEQA